MPKNCFQLLYFSRARKDLQQEDAADILAKSQTNNAQLNITGLLLFEHGHFLQLLEGPEQRVRDLYQRIAEDPRHTDATTIFTRSVAHREFADWSMLRVHIDTTREDLHSLFCQTCETGVAPEITVHRKSSAQQLIDFFKAMLETPPLAKKSTRRK